MYNNNQKKTVKWKRFSGASYAAFQSLHKEVGIGVLTVAMLGSAGLKAMGSESAGCASALGNATGDSPEALAADDTLTVGLEDVEILASRVPLTQMQAPRLVTVLSAVDIAAAAVHSINDLLEYAVGVDVRQRGEFGVQTDISVRGGTFDQLTLLLNGVNISSPHTGHLTADFPVTVQDIERIEVLEGPSARVFGTSAFTGVVNIVTRQEANEGSAHLYGGSYGYAGGDLRLSHQHKAGQGLMNHHLSGGYSRSDGATPNSDFGSTRAFYQGEFRQSDLMKVDLQLGYSYKQYGANTFYGAASTDQWESNERYMGALTAETRVGKVHLAPGVSWNRWFDHYQWHKGKAAGENYHQVDTWATTLNSWIENRWGKTSFGIEMRNEGIYSTKLGERMEESKWKATHGHDGVDSTQYKCHADRTNLSAFLEHDVLLDHWTFSLGMLANMNTALDYKWRLYPGVDIAWRPAHDWKFFLSWNMALRMPTYTDLYYSGTNIVGTSDLKPERTNDVSLGTRFRRQGWKAEASLFYSHKTDMIDWVIYADEADGKTFRSGNFTLDNVGLELNAAFLPQEKWQNCYLRKLGVQYAYIDEDIAYKREVKASKYAMEYLRHKVVIQAESKLWRKLAVSLSWRWQDRVGQGNKPYALLDGRLSWDDARWSLYADCSNLLDKTYYDYSYIAQPGRWGKIGFVYRFGR